MREIKLGFWNSKAPNIVVLHHDSQQQGLIRANRTLLLVASVLMVVVFILGFLLSPASDILDTIKTKNTVVSTEVENPVLSSEIKLLKSQMVGLISGSIESKLRHLEDSIRMGKINSSLGTLKDLKSDVKILQTYSTSANLENQQKASQKVAEEVIHLKKLIYLTLTSSGLMIVTVIGLWMRQRFYLPHSSDNKERLINR